MIRNGNHGNCYKFKTAEVRYEIGISIKSAEMVWAQVWAFGRKWPDLKIAKELYVFYAKDEKTLAD